MPAFLEPAWKADALPLGDSRVRTKFYHNQAGASWAGITPLFVLFRENLREVRGENRLPYKY